MPVSLHSRRLRLLGLASLLAASYGLISRPVSAPSLSPHLRQAEAAAERLRRHPASFSDEDLATLHRRFGVHGPQPALAQWLTEQLDRFPPRREQTLELIASHRGTILQVAAKTRINPVFLAAILFDEINHVKPGDDLLVSLGIGKTIGLAQLSVDELRQQGRLAADPDRDPDYQARAQAYLADPENNIRTLAGKVLRIQRMLGIPRGHALTLSHGYRDARRMALIALLHNGKADYPSRILEYMEDGELHEALYQRRVYPLVSS
jgi:hypothetical protein